MVCRMAGQTKLIKALKLRGNTNKKINRCLDNRQGFRLYFKLGILQFPTQPFKNQSIPFSRGQQVYCCAETAALPLRFQKHQHSAEAATGIISSDLSASAQHNCETPVVPLPSQRGTAEL